LTRKRFFRPAPDSGQDEGDALAGPALPPDLIKWMTAIERIAVDSNVGPIALVFEARLQAIMAGFAERTERPEHEGVVIAFMRRMMIRDRRRRRPARLEA
jgi:hypothetical protein